MSCTLRTTVSRLPRAPRIVKLNTCPSQTRTMAFFPRFAATEFGPLFRLLDDYSQHAATRSSGVSHGPALRSFQPRFDVKESTDAYELLGELPGIDQSNINIEFTDATTLAISGRSERTSERGTRPEALKAPGAEAQPQVEDAASDTASSHKATVEDDFEDLGTDTVAASPAAEASEQSQEQAEASTSEEQQLQQQQPQSKYWVSERSVGEFRRSFTFPARIDQDAVKASLKNGILSIVVPKAQAPAHRRINIE